MFNSRDKHLRQIDELREALGASERNSARTEERMRREREDLMTKLQDSEARHEELSGSMSTSTRPLLRQIESLQATLSEGTLGPNSLKIPVPKHTKISIFAKFKSWKKKFCDFQVAKIKFLVTFKSHF